MPGHFYMTTGPEVPKKSALHKFWIYLFSYSFTAVTQPYCQLSVDSEHPQTVFMWTGKWPTV